MKTNKTLLLSAFLSVSLALNAQTNNSDYFTAVMVGDPHVAQSNGTSVADMQGYVNNIINMGKGGGLHFQFASLPDYVPMADIVFCLGDMDGDSEKTGNNFKTAFAALNSAHIPFITMVGNHDIVPDYWTGDNPDKGLTFGFNDGGAYCNDVALGVVTDQLNTAKNYGVENVERFNDGTSHVQMEPFTFTFKGVRFYVGQTYWFQKTYTKPSLFSSATYYAPDGVINALESFVNNHTTEPSVWMQHYPIVAGSDNDRWWLDQNDKGLYIPPSDYTIYNTAKAKRDKLTDIIKRTKNPAHFSGHTHWYAENTYNGVKDYTVTSTFNDNCGAFIVLIHKTKGVVEVKRVNFWTHNTLSLCDPLETVSASSDDINTVIGHEVQEGEDVSSLLGDNLDFETTQMAGDGTFVNMHRQAGWVNIYSADANDANKGYIYCTQLTGQGSGATTTNALRLRAKWQENTIREQVYKELALPKGNYTLTYFIKASQQSWAQDLNFYELNGERTPLVLTTGWSKQTMEVNVTQPSVLKLSFGFIGGNGSNDCEVFVDDISLTYNGVHKLSAMAQELKDEVAIAHSLNIDTQDEELLLENEYATNEELQNATWQLRLDEYDVVSSDYQSHTDLGNPNDWTQTGGTGIASSQHWDGTSTSSYMEQSGANWGNTGWTIAYRRNLSLPAGRYLLKVACRSAEQVVAQVSADGKSANVPAHGDQGLGISTDGATNYSPEAQYANNGLGRGWTWRYVAFELTEARTVAFAMEGKTKGQNQWVSFANPVLLKKRFILGDVNDDGTVSVSDVLATVDYLLGDVNGVFIYEAANVNGDANISVSDVTSIVDIILNN